MLAAGEPSSVKPPRTRVSRATTLSSAHGRTDYEDGTGQMPGAPEINGPVFRREYSQLRNPWRGGA